MQQGTAQSGEADIAPAGDQIVRQPDNLPSFPLMADLRAAENEFQGRARQLEPAHDLGGRQHVPDIDAEADDLWRVIGGLAQFGQ